MTVSQPLKTYNTEVFHMMYRADSQVFLDEQTMIPCADPDLVSGLDLGIVTVADPFGPPDQPNTTTEQILANMTRNLCGMLTGGTRIELVLTSGDLKRINSRAGVVAIVTGLQRAPFDADRDNLARLMEAGVRISALSYSHQGHPLGGGCDDKTARLTDLGRQFLYDCAELGMIVDLSHSSHQTVRDVLELVERENLDLKLMASHGGCTAVYDDPAGRNLPNWALDGIASLGGFVGIYTMTFGVDPTDDSPQPFLDHLAHAIEVCGLAYVGLGSDAVYKQLDIPTWKARFTDLKAKIDPDGHLGARWPDFPVELNSPRRIVLLEELLRADERFTDEMIAAVLGQNLFDFLFLALPVD